MKSDVFSKNAARRRLIQYSELTNIAYAESSGLSIIIQIKINVPLIYPNWLLDVIVLVCKSAFF